MKTAGFTAKIALYFLSMRQRWQGDRLRKVGRSAQPNANGGGHAHLRGIRLHFPARTEGRKKHLV